MMPDNGAYAIAAYVAAGVIHLGYLWSLVSRRRKVRARLKKTGDRRPVTGDR